MAVAVLLDEVYLAAGDRGDDGKVGLFHDAVAAGAAARPNMIASSRRVIQRFWNDGRSDGLDFGLLHGIRLCVNGFPGQLRSGKQVPGEIEKQVQVERRMIAPKKISSQRVPAGRS